ncbi:MAG: selenide, water dikinase SelD, partial [Bacteroidia bacterium]|nr:selenide, water dikinase SelD [Bacteroidia bacterium]
LFALSVVCFPSDRLPAMVLKSILEGASSKASEAGIVIAGGHSITDNTIKFGLSVTGMSHPDSIWRNSGARPGDLLILTKEIGTGLVLAAARNGIEIQETTNAVIHSMKRLNKTAAEILAHYQVHACTDISGFGLLGHLAEMTTASLVNAQVIFADVPLFKGLTDLAAMVNCSHASLNNLDYIHDLLEWDSSLSAVVPAILTDPQTSGGLLVSVRQQDAIKLINNLKDAGIEHAAIIGKITGKGEGKIRIT